MHNKSTVTVRGRKKIIHKFFVKDITEIYVKSSEHIWRSKILGIRLQDDILLEFSVLPNIAFTYVRWIQHQKDNTLIILPEPLN